MSVPTTFRPTPRTRVRRHPERAAYDRDTVMPILDEGLICHLAFVVDGRPFAIPTMYARSGENLYVHGSPASRMLRTAGSGVDVCLTVTLLDGLVMARSAFSHSMNYRSVVVSGRAVEITDPEEKMLAFKALVDQVALGRWEDARQPNPKELATTMVLKLPLVEVSAKIRTGPPKDQEADLGLPVWAGEIPLRLVPSAPIPSPELDPGTPVPGYAGSYRRPG